MKKFKNILAGILTLAMLGSVAACSDTASKNDGTEAPKTSATDKVETEKATDAPATDAVTEPVTIKFSWWGGDSRHEATEAAVAKFMELNQDIKVETQFGAWTDWETAMSTAFYSGTAPDVNQINWNWITTFSSDGSIFADLNKYSNIIDLSQFDTVSLDQCVLAGKLQAVPVSMTGRIFYWNKTTFEKAGISTPTSLEELYAAAATFKEKLGDDYYPLVLGEYDRAILLVYYLESVYGKAWVTDGKLNYTEEEIAVGMQFFTDLEEKGVIPTIGTIADDGAASLDVNSKWIDGRYAGIFEWDSSAPKFSSAAADQEIIVGDYFKDFGEYQGGFSKVSLAFAITETTPYPEQCARLINFLLNEDEGTTIMASERGIPLSKKALANCTALGKLNAMTSEANGKVIDWVKFPLDPKFEDAKLKGNPDGYYYVAFSGLSYKKYDAAQAAKVLMDGINEVLGN